MDTFVFPGVDEYTLEDFADIPLVRVTGSPPAQPDSVFQLLSEASSRSSLPAEASGALKYSKHCKENGFVRLAKEGDKYQWLEAFATVEMFRCRNKLPEIKVPGSDGRTVGGADCYDNQDRPFDVKTPRGGDFFDPKTFVAETIVKRLLDKGGYDGYPAILILDLSFLAPEKRVLFFKEFNEQMAERGKLDERWRVIEVYVDYTNALGEGTYANYHVSIDRED